jgi:hypothetical protein
LSPSAADAERLFAVLRCSFKAEDLIFPEVNTFRDVFRLRRDKRFADFRETLVAFYDELSKGEKHGVEKIKREVRKANKALKSIGRNRRIGNIVTVVSIPTYVIDMLISEGILGLTFSVIGVGTMVHSTIQKKRHRWVLLGQT